MGAPCFAAAPASSAAICRATAPAPPAAAAVAKDGESTGALCPAHNLSSSLPQSASVSLIAGVLRLPLQVPRLTPRMSQVVAMLLILLVRAPASLSSSAVASPCCSTSSLSTRVLVWLPVTGSPPDANEAAASQVLRAPSSSLCVSQPVSVRPAHSFSLSVSALPSFSSSSVTLLIFFSPSVTPHSRSICSLCLCSDQCMCCMDTVHAVLFFIDVNTPQSP